MAIHDLPPPTWHQQTPESVLRLIDSRADGLTDHEAETRRAQYGDNLLVTAARRSALRMLLAQFGDVMVLVLIGAALVAMLVGEAEDTLAIVAIVLLNAVLGFVQEYRAEQALAALGQMAAPSARVRRAGREQSIAAHRLVPGDLVLLEAGNVVPADLRLLHIQRLAVDESALTGESLAVEKHTAALDDAELPLGDRRNLAYKGTTVTAGRAEGVVVTTGMRTELGRIAAMLGAQQDPRSPLQLRLAAFGRRLAVLVLGLCAVIFAAGLLRGEDAGLMFMTALSLAVAAIPEALPAVITVALALGARRMVRQQALIRRLPAVETLGSVTFICTDKTGTLTQNRMQVDRVRAINEHEASDAATEGAPVLSLAEAVVLCNDATPQPDGSLLGDPTETALLQHALSHGVDLATLRQCWPRVNEIPFTSERARMTTVHAHGDTLVACMKGAPEQVLPRCQASAHAAEAMQEAETMAAEGLRVLAVAVRSLPPGDTDHVAGSALDANTLERHFTLLALVGLLDPPREEAAQAVAQCRSAGIQVVMITGDHPATARAIAARVGIDSTAPVLSGREVAGMDDGALRVALADTRVFARVAPEDKLRIVQALQARGEYAAMTGDGVNDAPALRQANIGVAMGRGGTDVAREAAHMVLLDDNFATIVRAVREGRRIYDNIRRFVRFVLSTNSGEIWTLFLAPLLGLPLPLLPMHILWMNLVTDGLPGLALTAERAEPDVMQRPPRPPSESIFAHGLWQHAVWVGLLMAGLALGTQAWALRQNNARWQTLTFTVLTLSQLAHVLAVRSERHPLWRIGPFSNPLLLGAVLLTFVLQVAITHTPALAQLFRIAPLSLAEWGLCVGVASVVYVAVEIEKVFIRTRGWYADVTPRS
ncbi:MAG: ATPase [Gemmatimonas sp.]|uniref:cation-translocating P-type ATPase n=1 Tax=Gemmatimonas sp. UBA7669 TaxID=1946568 RepID=UPI0025BB1E12|nr:cation-translocating P-type ATPase [Gemmatimonas sp. UBA7669]MBA3919939.1 ATPase [Gemmatimonas sp.]